MDADGSDDLPLAGLLIVDMCQFLSGPYASLRLQDMGARVIKIERPDGGDLCRRFYLSDTEIGGDSTIFHAINRSKQSLALDLKLDVDRAALWQLISHADVVLQNFRPGVIERLGFDHASVRAKHPKIVYGSISGYGHEGPWAHSPGQDLLAQARSGIMWLSGDDSHGPVPFGLPVADIMAGAALAQGILASLFRRERTGKGAHVETSLLEALVDLQFEVLTTHLNDGQRPPKRSVERSAHAYLSAPYGVYQTADGYIAIAMTPLARLEALLETGELDIFMNEPRDAFVHRDAIKSVIARKLRTQATQFWLDRFQPADIWCAAVLDWPDLMGGANFKALDLLQTLNLRNGVNLSTTRIPLRFDGYRPACAEAAPTIGQDSAAIRAEFSLDKPH